jgi:hypothetical protein
MRARATQAPIAASPLLRSASAVADVAGSRRVARPAGADLRSGRVRAGGLVAVPVAGVLLALWLIADPRTPDLAAQVYRVGLFEHLGFSVWDEHWYAGHYLPGYSLLFPALASLVGLRLLAVLSVLCSCALFERLAGHAYGSSARWGAAMFAVAAVGDVWIGRLVFAMGVSLALACVLALLRGRTLWACVLSGLCAAASPVAGMLLALAGVTYALKQRSLRPALVVAAPACAVAAAVAALFPEGGFEPYPTVSFAVTVLVVLAFLWALPDRRGLLGLGALVYLAACVLCLFIHTPMGSNIERYGVLLAGPLLLCAVAQDRALTGRRLGLAALLALSAAAVWVAWGPVRETLVVAGNESTEASYYAPVERFLDSAQASASGPVRVEVPFTRSHWEAALLAPRVSLARGWEKQLDTRFDGPLLAHGLTASAYGRWLHQEAVAYVALPDTRLDPSSAEEGRLIRRGLPFLREVFASRHWTIYRVLAPTPLLSGPGRLTALGNDSFALRAFSPGRFLVRVRFTRFWTLARGDGCVAQARSGWTSVTARAPGTMVIAARFSVARALGAAGACTTAPSA